MPRRGIKSGSNTTTVESQGGIGNQLFIYAFALALQTRSANAVQIDTWRHSLPGGRPYQILDLMTDSLPVTSSGIGVGPVSKASSLLRHWGERLSLPPSITAKRIAERSFSFDKSLLTVPPGSVVRGYFQSWRYFADIAEDLRHGLQEKRDLLMRGFTGLPEASSVAVHLRLGDYKSVRHSQMHGLLPADYYRLALERLDAMTDEHLVTVYSDSPVEAVELIKEFLPEDRIRLPRGAHSDLTSMLLLSRHDGIVCANSTFSWWAAWISGLPGNRIVAPRQWINRPDYHPADLIPEGWLQQR